MGVDWKAVARGVRWYETHDHTRDGERVMLEYIARVTTGETQERALKELDKMALQNATAFVAPPKVEYLSPTVLYERGQAFYLHRVHFEDRADPKGNVVPQALADVFNGDGENIGKMATGARYVVEALQAFCGTNNAPELIGPLRMEKGERAYFLVPDTEGDIPF